MGLTLMWFVVQLVAHYDTYTSIIIEMPILLAINQDLGCGIAMVYILRICVLIQLWELLCQNGICCDCRQYLVLNFWIHCFSISSPI